MTIAGLILNIVGVALLFKFGFPQPAFEEGVGLGLELANVLEDGRTVAEHDEATRRKKRLYRFVSSIGLSLVLLGLLLQLTGAIADD